MADRPHIILQHLSASSRVWYVVGGVAFLIMAMIAFAIPVQISFGANLWLGALLIIAGVAEIVSAIRRHDGWGAAGEALFGIVTVIAGLLAVIFPIAGLIAFTMAIALFFLVSGGVRIAQALQRRPARLWYLRLISGLVSLGLGLYLVFLLPQAALVTLGVLIAVDFAFFGVALILIGVYGERPLAVEEASPAF